MTEPLRSAARPPPQPPGGCCPGLYIPGRARPAPAPLRPPAFAAAAPAPGLLAALGQRPFVAARTGARPSSPFATQGAPSPQESPLWARAGCLGGYPKARGESGKTAGGGGQLVGKTHKLGRGVGRHCGYGAWSGRAGGGGGARAGLQLT